MEKVKKPLLILGVLLFCLNYSICEIFYPNMDEESIQKWWDLRVNIYSVLFACILISYSIEAKGWLKFILHIGVGLSVSSLIDKIFLNVHSFTEADLLMIAITFIIATINLIKDRLNGQD